MKRIPDTIDKLCKQTDQEKFNKIMKYIPKETQEILIEAAIVAYNMNTEKNKHIREFILAYFAGFIRNIEDVWVSKLLSPRIRCINVDSHNFREWYDCDKKYLDKFEELFIKEQNKLKEKYLYTGLYNGSNGAFCIVNVKKEKEKLKDGQLGLQHRFPGQVCKNYNTSQLLGIIIDTFNIGYPDESTITIKKKKNKINNLTIKELLNYIKHAAKINKIYTPEQLNLFTIDKLRKIVYWGSKNKYSANVGADTICKGLYNYMNELGIIKSSTDCGTGQKVSRSKALKKKPTPKIYRIIQVQGNSEEMTKKNK